MAYVLICALCGGGAAAGGGVVADAASSPAFTLRLGRTTPATALSTPMPFVLAEHDARLPLADHSGHDGGGGSHIGPMWIVMGVMMVAMMVALGVYMMRGNAVGSVDAFGATPHLSAIPVSAGVRPGG